MTFQEYVDGINKMAEEHPEYLELEMYQIERWDGDAVGLPEIAYPFMSFEEPKIII